MKAWNYWTFSEGIWIISSKTKEISDLFRKAFAKNFLKNYTPISFVCQKKNDKKFNNKKTTKD